jgi:hypothetical protein
MVVDLPLLPSPESDVVQEEDGYSAEVSVERELTESEWAAFSDAVRGLAPVVRVAGAHEVRGLVSLDDDTLWVSVHDVGPGPYDADRQAEDRRLIEELWREVHAAAGARGA